MPDYDEPSLIASCKAGNLEDFALLYDHYADPIYRYIRYRVRDEQLAEDLTSNTFLKAMENVRSFNGTKGTFSGWLYRIARNGVIDHYRSNKYVQRMDEDFDAPGDEDATRGISQSMAKAQVQEMLASLDSDKRDILLMRIWDGLSYQEIAEITGKSETNCKVIVSRTLAGLRETFPASALALLLISSPLFR